jgi:hypothetical protein
VILNQDDRHTGAYAELEDAIQAMTSRPVILNAQSCDPYKLPPGIIYNLENVPLQVDPSRYRGLGRDVWDFSEENIRDYPGGLSPVHVPIGYHPTMTRFEMKPEAERDIDVLCYGAMSGRRAAVYNELRAYGLRVETCAAYGSERDEMISRTKCLAVIPYLAPFVFPILRAAHLVANGVPFVAEEGIEVPFWVARTCEHKDLFRAVLDVVKRGDPYARARLYAFKSQPMTLPR